MKKKIDELSLTIRLSKTEHYQQSLNIISSGADKLIMDEIRKLLKAADTQELKLLSERKNSHFKHMNYYYMNAIWSITAITLLLILLVKLQTRRKEVENERDKAVLNLSQMA